MTSQSFEVLINNLVDGVIEIDPSGSVRMYNASALRILDTNVTLTGLNINKVMKVTDISGKKLKLLDIIKPLDHVSVFDEILYKLTNDEEIRLELTISPIKDAQDYNACPEISGYIIIIRDITQVKDLEAERDEFIGIVSHELRTPITVVEGTLSNLDVVISKKADYAIIKKFADVAHDQIMLLANMTNDLSSLSRAERTKAVDKDQINIEQLTASLAEKYSKEIEKKGLSFNLDTRFGVKTICTNCLYLEEILQNLIVNAIKYTKEGSITLGVAASKSEVKFFIKDTGIGISRADQANIFRKFFRVEDYRTRETTGTGLGLYVSQKLAEKLGTKIEIQSRINYGSTFSLTIRC